MHVRKLGVLAVMLAVCACSPDGRENGNFGEGADPGANDGADDGGDGDAGDDGGAGEDGGEDDGGGEDGADDGGDDEGGMKYDVAGDDPTGNPGDGELGCTAVDVLFVIDDSGSMQPYQQALAQTFPCFVDAMFADLPPETDLHVGITSTSFGDPSAGGKGGANCTNEPLNAEALADHYPPPSQNNGQNGGQGRLFEHAGKRYFEADTSGDPTALMNWFTGAAVAVGEQGSNWEMVSAGGAWVTHPENAAFNAGFLRDVGTVLVIFVLTDEYDNSPEDVSAYHDMLVGAKAGCGGDLCIVAGGMTPPCVHDTPNNILSQFLSSFGEPPVLGNVGTEDDTSHYCGVVGDTLAQVVAEACEEIPPEG